MAELGTIDVTAGNPFSKGLSSGVQVAQLLLALSQLLGEDQPPQVISPTQLPPLTPMAANPAMPILAALLSKAPPYGG